MEFKLAWRNIWRNRRRTFITAASILFAVMLASMMEALQKGAWNHMINNVVNFYFGYAQIHEKGYWADQSLDKAFAMGDDIRQLPEKVRGLTELVPRLESFALASTGSNTIGTLVVGIDPAAEKSMTQLDKRVTQGTFLEPSDEAALVAEGVAERLNLKMGDTLVLVSQGYHGVNAAGKYPVKGIVHFGSPDLNKQMVYLPLKAAQWFYGADGLITSVALKIDNPREVQHIVRQTRHQLDLEKYEVLDWQELLPDLVQAKALDSAGNYIVYFILYAVIAFGIFGTILMMSKERAYEFGVLVAIGMRRMKLGIMVWIEIMLLGLLGAVAGIICSLPVIGYFHTHPMRFSGDYAQTLEKFGFEPIFPAAFEMWIFLLQASIVLIITTVLALYPLLKIRNLKPVEAMRE